MHWEYPAILWVKIICKKGSSQQKLCPTTSYCCSQRYRLFIIVMQQPHKLVLHMLIGVSVHACFSVSLCQ